MNKNFYDICYEVLWHYLHFPDVANTYKSINDGLDYMRNFPQDIWNFRTKKGEIISYIQTMRLNNIIDAYQDPSNMLLLVPVPSWKPLADASPEELYNNLAGEIPRLILKGIHQTVKHLNENLNDNLLTAELIQQDTRILKKYGLQDTEEIYSYGQA